MGKESDLVADIKLLTRDLANEFNGGWIKVFEFILMIFLAMMFLILGLLIWKKEKIGLLHSYHYSKVLEEDKKSYTEEMGKSLIIIAIGLFLTGTVEFFSKTKNGWIFFVVSLLLGFVKMSRAQYKYNKGWF